MRAQFICASILLLAATALAAGNPRPAKPTGSWSPYELGTDQATAYYKGYKASGKLLKTITTPYAQGCYWACMSNQFNTDPKVFCFTWAFETKTKKCTLLKSTSSSENKGAPCATWAVNKGYVSGWIYNGNDFVDDWPACKP